MSTEPSRAPAPLPTLDELVRGSITDVDGIRVGHCTRDEPGWLTGVTVVLPPEGGAVCGVDVRGGGPGTRETDLLDPRNVVDRVNALVLAGGSAMGLAAADGVAHALWEDGIGWPVGEPGQVVPIVPSAICFDLGRGGEFRNAPTAQDGASAYAAARASSPGAALPRGCVGAGTGALTGQAVGRPLKGGLGSASTVLPSGHTVAALVVVNAVGSTVTDTGDLWAAGALGEPCSGRELPLLASPLAPGQATTIGVIATDAVLTKAQCQKMSGIAHDGLARAVRPVHTLLDGDTFFTLATGRKALTDNAAEAVLELAALMEAGARTVTAAIADAMRQASAVDRSAQGGLSAPALD